MKENNTNREKNLVEIVWDGINALDLGTILGMWSDGYCFHVNDGEISSLLMAELSV